MLTLEIVNDGTGDEVVGNYRYRALVNGREIDSGEVKGHARSAGWAALVSLVGRRACELHTFRVYAEYSKMMAERQEVEG